MSRRKDRNASEALATFSDLVAAPDGRAASTSASKVEGAAHSFQARIHGKRLTLANLDRPRPKPDASQHAGRQVARRDRRMRGGRGADNDQNTASVSLSARRYNRRATAESKAQLSFQSLIPVHQIWLDYIHRLLNIPVQASIPAASAILPASAQELPDDIAALQHTFQNNAAMLGAIAKADMTGAYIRVKRSLNPALVGIEGLVALETEGTFIIVQKQTQDTSGQPGTAALEFELFGNQLCNSLPTRSTKKFKARKTIDL